jgi:arylsulfatase A-like enzyme
MCDLCDPFLTRHESVMPRINPATNKSGHWNRGLIFLFVIENRRLQMKRRRFIGTVTAGLCAGSAMTAASGTANPVNVLLMLADDMGFGDLGCYGQTIITTPNFDRMAEEGMRFTRSYSGSTVCAPSRCVLMTGKHIGHARVRGNGPGELLPEDMTLAKLMKNAGYTTGYFGKWGVGRPDPAGDDPNRNGFDEFYGYVSMNHAHNFFPEFMVHNGQKIKLRNELMEQFKGDFQANPQTYGSGVAREKIDYAPDLIREKLFEFLAANHQRPFFIYYAPNTPHANNEGSKFDLHRGLEVPAFGEFADRDWPVEEKGFATKIRNLDNDVGRLMAKLKEYGIERNTLFIFSSDNGPHQEGGHQMEFFDSNGEKRGMKRDLYEGGVRVPMIIRQPGTVPAGTLNESIVAFQDAMPTLAELTGQPCPETDGRSLLPYLTGAEKFDIDRSLYWEFGEGTSKQAILKGDWKLVRFYPKKGKTKQATPYMELYNVTTDPSEEHDVAQKHPERVANLLREMRSMMDADTIINDPDT